MTDDATAAEGLEDAPEPEALERWPNDGTDRRALRDAFAQGAWWAQAKIRASRPAPTPPGGGEDDDAAIQEAYDEGYSEGKADGASWGEEAGRYAIDWLLKRGVLAPPDTDPEWSAQDIIDGLAEYEATLKRAAAPSPGAVTREKIAKIVRTLLVEHGLGCPPAKAINGALERRAIEALSRLQSAREGDAS